MASPPTYVSAATQPGTAGTTQIVLTFTATAGDEFLGKNDNPSYLDGSSIQLNNGHSAVYGTTTQSGPVSGVYTDKIIFSIPTSELPAGDINNAITGSTGLMYYDGLNNDPYSVCYMAGVRIATPSGDVAVEELAIGDLVLTTAGEVAPVRWIGRQTVSRLFADPMRMLPIRVKAGALGEALPVRDLLVSPGHALLVDGVLVQAGALVNGGSIVRETDLPTTFVYYHVELDDQSLILAEGVAAETFVDNVERTAFDNWAEHEALYPQGKAIPEMARPRAKSHRQVPRSIRERLAARSAALFEAQAAA